MGWHYVVYFRDEDSRKHASDSTVQTATLQGVEDCELSTRCSFRRLHASIGVITIARCLCLNHLSRAVTVNACSRRLKMRTAYESAKSLTVPLPPNLEHFLESRVCLVQIPDPHLLPFDPYTVLKLQAHMLSNERYGDLDHPVN